jgi:Sulfotransferase family
MVSSWGSGLRGVNQRDAELSRRDWDRVRAVWNCLFRDRASALPSITQDKKPAPLPYRIAMMVGLPRSGTTFLQIVLTAHPEIATARETHLFDRYLGPMFRSFGREEVDLMSADGLRYHLGHAGLIEHFRAIALSVLTSIHAKHPGASVVLEKTPGHLGFIPLIRDCLPEAKFIHVVRDPRGFGASMKAASKEVWGSWARRDMRDIGQWWTKMMATAHESAEALGDDYRQIRYEDLFVDGAAIVNDLYRWLGLSTIADLPNDLRQRFPISAMAALNGEATDPRVEARERFFRRGDPQAWREELSGSEIEAIEQSCAETMIGLGYVPLNRTSASPQPAQEPPPANPL